MLFALAAALLWFAGSPECRAQDTQRLPLPPAARAGLDLLYRGDPDAAIEQFRRVQASEPNSPVGFLLEADALWWRIYCRSLEFKWNILDIWALKSSPETAAILAAADKAVALAEEQLRGAENGELNIYAGMGYLLRARVIGMLGDRRGTARAGVKAREHFLRAKHLDPQLADADTGLGLYNYYADALSTFTKVLRFFMGIPGGSKTEGVTQLIRAMSQGDMTAVEARFYLAKNLRLYDEQYIRAAELMEPLAEQYPQNPIFALMVGNLNALLDRKEKAAASYRAAEAMAIPDPACRARVAHLSHEGLASLGLSQ